MPSCGGLTTAARELACRNTAAAAHLKIISILVIFITSVVGISSPVMLAKSFQGKPVYDKATLVIKCFAAGVILSTSLVHVLPDAFDALNDCAVSTKHPWKDFPFGGLVTLLGALLALFVELTASHSHSAPAPAYQPLGPGLDGSKSGSGPGLTGPTSGLDGPKSGCGPGLVGPGSGCGPGWGVGMGEMEAMRYRVLEKEEEGGEGEEVRGGGNGEKGALSVTVAVAETVVEEVAEKMRQRMVSQVLEIGIIFHSVIIGVTMGMSQNVCTIRPLVAALAFHQIFEGMGLGGCIAQAGFSFRTTTYMCFMFAVTTPVGIVLGMLIFAVTGYDDSSPNALILEGLLGSLSSGILIYMALVDLISADFFHNKMMSAEANMKKGCFVALVLGSASMSILALWA